MATRGRIGTVILYLAAYLALVGALVGGLNEATTADWSLALPLLGATLAMLVAVGLVVLVRPVEVRARLAIGVALAVLGGVCVVVPASMELFAPAALVERTSFEAREIEPADARSAMVLPRIVPGCPVVQAAGQLSGFESADRREQIALGPLLVVTRRDEFVEVRDIYLRAYEERPPRRPSRSDCGTLDVAHAPRRWRQYVYQDNAPEGLPRIDVSAIYLTDATHRVQDDTWRDGVALFDDAPHHRLVLLRPSLTRPDRLFDYPLSLHSVPRFLPPPAAPFLAVLTARAPCAFVLALAGTLLAALLLVASVLRRAPSSSPRFTAGTLDDHGTVHLGDSVTLPAPPGLPPGPVLVRTRALAAPAFRAPAVLAREDIRPGSLTTLREAHHARTAALALLSLGVAALAVTPVAVLWAALRSLPH